jgi:hypothetical protein
MGKTPTPRFLPKAAPATGSSQDAAPVEDRTTDNNNVAIRTMMDIRPRPCWLVIGERLWLSWSLLSTRPSTKPKLKRTCLGREQAFSQSKCHSSKTNSAEIAEGRSFQIVLNIVPSPILRPRLQFAFL